MNDSPTLFPRETVIKKLPSSNALENDFPAIAISRLAEAESWRKEVHRPATHTHKWWAKRLGTVFRGVIVSSVSKNSSEAMKKYSELLDLHELTLFDPFAGSGTTLVEATKMKVRTIGRDINPVATLVQRQALVSWDREKLVHAYSMIEEQCKSTIESYYRTESGDTVLYYFWVATTECPECGIEIKLFSSRIFSRNAYPKKHPEVKAVCIECGDILTAKYNDDKLTCKNGHTTQAKGEVSGPNMTCKNGHTSKVLPSFGGKAPHYEMYAKLVLTNGNKKIYEPITDFDIKLYRDIERQYKKVKNDLVVPNGQLEDGINTRQAKSWGFNSWDKFFNTRQLLALGLLAKSIKNLPADEPTREAMTTLFSGTLEFNNLFCSFKGEGTGAVRHMFSHHILKPERVPLEANPWGTKYSSGSFSTLFNSRLMRAYEYKKSPSDLILMDGSVKKLEGIATPIAAEIAENWKDFIRNPSAAYVACGDSSKIDIPDGLVDLVITDPPYMDNVHYSELADFFHAWLKDIMPYKSYNSGVTTRSEGEVQSANPDDFSAAIEKVWVESARVLKTNGLIAFTFHQARITGWVALVKALKNADLVVTAIQPIKGEMATSVTKAGAANPSNLDSIVVCRKRASRQIIKKDIDTLVREAKDKLDGLQSAGIKVGMTDIYSVIRGTVLSSYTRPTNDLDLIRLSELADDYSRRIVDELTLTTNESI